MKQTAILRSCAGAIRGTAKDVASVWPECPSLRSAAWDLQPEISDREQHMVGHAGCIRWLGRAPHHLVQQGQLPAGSDEGLEHNRVAVVRRGLRWRQAQLRVPAALAQLHQQISFGRQRLAAPCTAAKTFVAGASGWDSLTSLKAGMLLNAWEVRRQLFALADFIVQALPMHMSARTGALTCKITTANSMPPIDGCLSCTLAQ